jgi:hypothetical protein
MEIARAGSTIDVWSLAVEAKVDLQTLSYRTLPRHIDKVGSFTPRYNTTEHLPSFSCESGTYYAFLLACPQGALRDDCWVDFTSTKEKPMGVWLFSYIDICGLTLSQQGSIWCRNRQFEFFCSTRRLFNRSWSCIWIHVFQNFINTTGCRCCRPKISLWRWKWVREYSVGPRHGAPDSD